MRVAWVLVALVLTACGGGGSAPPDPVVVPPSPIHSTAPSFNHPSPPAPPNDDGFCGVYDAASLQSCLKEQNAGIRFIRDVVCTDCCPNGKALLDLEGKKNFTVSGRDYQITRRQQHKQCPVVSLKHSSNILIHGLNIDEDERVTPCMPEERCPGTIDMHTASNVTMQLVNIYSPKAFGVHIWKGDGITFDHSTVSNAGVIGFYAGNGTYNAEFASSKIVVTNSVFARARTNAVALQGAWGPGADDNKIENNIFTGNHYEGLWMAPDTDGIVKVYPGGQVYLPNIRYASVSHNIIGNGYCANCATNKISAVEIGAPGEGPVVALNVNQNYIYNIYGYALFLNHDVQIGADSLVWDNVTFGSLVHIIHGSGQLHLGDATVMSNVFANSSPSLDHGGHATYIIHRLAYNGLHLEAERPDERPGAVLEATFELSPHPRPNANPLPIFRCFRGNADNDFPSMRKDCDGRGSLHSILGYSFEDGKSFFRCGNDADQFVSWDSNCEGKPVIGRLGFAR